MRDRGGWEQGRRARTQEEGGEERRTDCEKEEDRGDRRGGEEEMRVGRRSVEQGVEGREEANLFLTTRSLAALRSRAVSPAGAIQTALGCGAEDPLGPSARLPADRSPPNPHAGKNYAN